MLLCGYRPLNSVVRRHVAYRALAQVIELLQSAECTDAQDKALQSHYLAALAPLLASVVLGNDILSDIPRVEATITAVPLHGHDGYESAIDKWREFRDEYQRFAARAMTVNERLYAFGLMERYDRAVSSRDVTALANILREVYVDDSAINPIVTKVLGDA